MLANRQSVAFRADRRAAAPVSLRTAGRVVRSRVAQPVVCQATAAGPRVEFKDLLNMTYYPTSADAARSNKKWYVIDAEGQTLGRLASLAAMYIRGKHLATYSPSMDMGSYVVVLNADKVTVTGSKTSDKTYFRHVNGRPGSYTIETFQQLQQRLPERIIERAVKGMLPKGRLGRDIKLHLKVYKGTAHDHVAQAPIDITKEISIKPMAGPGAAVLAAKKAAAKK